MSDGDPDYLAACFTCFPPESIQQLLLASTAEWLVLHGTPVLSDQGEVAAFQARLSECGPPQLQLYEEQARANQLPKKEMKPAELITLLKSHNVFRVAQVRPHAGLQMVQFLRPALGCLAPSTCYDHNFAG
jgi:hypothetical protein